MPVYNRARFVRTAIESVLAQDADFELVIVDDGSTDGSFAIASEYAARDRRIVLLRSERNEGIAAALNKGVAAARGKYIAPQDSDDISLPHRLARQAAVLDASPDVAIVAMLAELIDVNGRHVRTLRTSLPSDAAEYLLHFSNVIGGNGRAMFRREALLAAGGYRGELSVDYDLWSRLRHFGRIVVLPLPGMQYRVHDERVSVRRFEQQRIDTLAVSRRMLSERLGREVAEEELTPLAAIWRGDPVEERHSGRSIHRLLREADRTYDGPHRRRIRAAIARHWALAAVTLTGRGQLSRAARHLGYGMLWSARTASMVWLFEVARATMRRLRVRRAAAPSPAPPPARRETFPV